MSVPGLPWLEWYPRCPVQKAAYLLCKYRTMRSECKARYLLLCWLFVGNSAEQRLDSGMLPPAQLAGTQRRDRHLVATYASSVPGIA
eukprot:3258189-Rhodomonas_salina.3